MCSSRTLLSLAAFVAGFAAPMHGQSPEETDRRERGLLARAESLHAQVVAQSLTRDSVFWRRLAPRVLRSRGATFVVGEAVSALEAQRALDSGLTLLRTSGAVPERFVNQRVLVGMVDWNGEAFKRLGLDAHRLIRVDVNQSGPDSAPTWSVNSDAVARAVAWAYKDSLDLDWRNWLPYGYATPQWTRAHAWRAFQDLTRAPLSVAGRCASGEVAGCRLWLAVDRDTAPFAQRYTAADLRSQLGESSDGFAGGASELRHACLEGDDAACVAFFQRQRYPSVPASEASRRGFLNHFRAAYGAGAIERALADTTGSIGQRFSRAAGVSEDSLVTRWRYWALTRGGQPRDRSTVADAAPGLVLAAVLLALVARGRRS